MKPLIVEEIPSALLARYAAGAGDCALEPARGLRVNGAGPDEYAETLSRIAERGEPSLALYLHLPFCPVRCHYCACNTNVTHDARKIDGYLDTLEREMDLVVERIGTGRRVHDLHVGGGTPNYLGDSQLARLMEMVDERFSLDEDAAPCIECSPRRASAGQLELLAGLGFRCISLGVQDLDANVQRAIGRVQSLNIVRDVCVTARGAGIENINVDLIHGLPEQTEAEFAETLEQIVSLEPDRIRCFGYVHAPSLRPHQFAIDSRSLPDASAKLGLFRRAVNDLTQSGYVWIGADCFAREDDRLSRAQAERRLHRNGIGYTDKPADHVLALGTFGLGEVDHLFVQNEPLIADWARAVNANRLPIAWGHRLSEQDLRRRRAYEHLLCNLELPAEMVEAVDEDRESLRRCIDDGLLEHQGDSIRVTPRGRFFLRDLCAGKSLSLDWESAQWRYPKST